MPVTTFDQKIAELLNNWVVGNNQWPVGNLILCAIAVLLSVLLCGAIGIEREWRGRSAGLRTHLLVGVGSCIIMIISIYGFPAMFGEKRDVARLAAQIITGVGFLGAGAIIHRSNSIKGLTTAGTIWVVMAIGIACGSFNFILAICSTGVIFVVLTFFRKIEVGVNKRNPIIILSAPADEPTLNKILAVSKEFECEVHGLSTELVEDADKKTIEYTFQAVFQSANKPVVEYVAKLESEAHASKIQLINHK